MIFSKHYRVREANRDEDVVAIPPEFVINNAKKGKTKLWLYMDKANRLVVSYKQENGLYRMSKRSQVIRGSDTCFFISVPLQFLERNNIQRGQKTQMEIEDGKLYIKPYYEEEKKSD